MNAKNWLVTILSCGAIGTVLFIILSDIWFHQTLIGRGIAILLLSGGAYAIWIGGVVHGISEATKDD